VKGFGPQKFKELHESSIAPGELLAQPREMQRFGKRGLEFQRQIEAAGALGRETARERAAKQIEAAKSNNGAILTYQDPLYPRVLFDSNLPVPALYARGDFSALKSKRTVACVGSRNIRPPYDSLHDAFSRLAVSEEFTIVSGFATGADIIGHLAAEDAAGFTICVMPSGLDRPFPPEHRDIWRRFTVAQGAVFVSEFGFGVGANALNLRKRNKMIAGCARGVLVSQSAEDGGAMNAYRFAMEQKKPVATFEADGTHGTSGNDLIAGSAERVRATVLPISRSPVWSTWLHSL
jgi:DNA processing protein